MGFRLRRFGAAAFSVWMFCAFAPVWADGPARPMASCPLIEQAHAPTIDGKLDEAVWAQAKPLSAFELVGDGPVTQQTHARVLCDGDRLFIGVVCDETHMKQKDGGGLLARVTKRDGSVWNDDCIEIFIAPRPGHPDYFQVIAGAGGGVYDGKGKDPSFDTQVDTAVTLNDRSWTIEVAIDLTPLFKEVGMTGKLKRGDAMRFNLCREEKPHGELSCWSAGGGGFHNTESFSDLIIGSLDERETQLLVGLDRAMVAASDAVKTLDANAQMEFSKLHAWATQLRTRAAGQVDKAKGEQLLREVQAAQHELNVLAMRKRGLLIWKPKAWQMPMPEDLPDAKVQRTDAVERWALKNEWEVDALAVTNFTRRQVRCHVSVSDFRSVHTGATVPAGQIVTLRTAVASRLSDGSRFLDALPLLQEGNLLAVGGESTQVLWLTFRTQGLAPGRYNAALTVYDLEQTNVKQHVRLTLTVYPVALDGGALPYTECWDYWSLPGIPLAAKQQHYKDYYLNVSTVSHAMFPGYDDGAGRVLDHTSRDFRRLDQFIAETRGFAKFYLLDMQPWDIHLQFVGTERQTLSEEYKRRLKAWVEAVRDHMTELGFGLDQWAWFPMDEPGNYKRSVTPSSPQYFPNICKVFKEIDPNMQIYVTWGGGKPETHKMLEDCVQYVDVFQTIPQHHVPQTTRDRMVSRGANIWDYVICYKVDGYWKLRGSLPINVTVGSRGMGFWSWSYIQGPSNWDSYDNRNPIADCSVIYFEDGTIIPSLRAESFRQGVEDFKYWIMLDRAIERATKSGIDSTLVDRAKAQRQRIVAAIQMPPANNSPAWVEDFRVTVRDQLIALGVADGTVDAALVRTIQDPGPACLTGNAAPYALNLHTGAVYWHDQAIANDRTAGGNWQWKANEAIYFREADAPADHPLSGKANGALWSTVGALEFMYSPIPAKAAITIDLKKTFNVERVVIAPTHLVLDGNAVLQVKAGDKWITVADGKDARGELDKARGTVELSFAPRKARYLRLNVSKPPNATLITLNHVQVWGRPVD